MLGEDYLCRPPLPIWGSEMKNIEVWLPKFCISSLYMSMVTIIFFHSNLRCHLKIIGTDEPDWLCMWFVFVEATILFAGPIFVIFIMGFVPLPSSAASAFSAFSFSTSSELPLSLSSGFFLPLNPTNINVRVLRSEISDSQSPNCVIDFCASRD